MDRSDRCYLESLHFLGEYKGALWTTWPVIMEASHMISFSAKVRGSLLQRIDHGGIRIFNLNETYDSRSAELTYKFSKGSMDLANASLMVVSEQKGNQEIASIDADY